MDEKKSGWGIVIVIILISLGIVAAAANYKKDAILNKKIEEQKKFREVYQMQDNATNKLYTIISERDHYIEDQNRQDYNFLRGLIDSKELINPYLPTADCVRVGPVNSSVFGLDCKKK